MPLHLAAAVLRFPSDLMRIASWNVNSIKARLDIVVGWLAGDNCDVLLIQETKSQDVNFPIFKTLFSAIYSRFSELILQKFKIVLDRAGALMPTIL